MSSVCMPRRWPVCITDVIWWSFPSRMRFRTAGVPIRTSHAATRPPPFFLSRVCATTASSDSESMVRICPCWPAGNTSMMRSMVFGALEVWSVPNTRWPVSAAVSASEIVSRSRISPIRITSGSSRSALRNAFENELVCGPTSRWFTRQRFGGCTNSIGSSIVRMCASHVWLMTSTMAARVVDLPEPVGPVTRTRPRSRVQSSFRTGGMCRVSRAGICVGMVRSTAPGPRL